MATNEAKIVNNREIPDICLQHLCAVMLIDKTVTFKSAHELARMTRSGRGPSAREDSSSSVKMRSSSSCLAGRGSSRSR